MPVSARINSAKLLDILAAAVTPRLSAIGDRIVDEAKDRVPVGHGERQGKPEAIRPRSSRGLSGIQVAQLREINAGVAEDVFRRAIKNRPPGQSVLEAQHEFAKLFRFTGKGGGTPERVDIRKTVLRGFRRTKPHLRDTIRNEGVERRGNVLHLTVAARSDHAYQVEKGFHHAGGTQVVGHPYLCPALQSVRNGLEDGSSLKG